MNKYTENDRLVQLSKVNELWRQASEYDGRDPSEVFIVFSENNPYSSQYDIEAQKLQEIANELWSRV